MGVITESKWMITESKWSMYNEPLLGQQKGDAVRKLEGQNITSLL